MHGGSLFCGCVHKLFNLQNAWWIWFWWLKPHGKIWKHIREISSHFTQERLLCDWNNHSALVHIAFPFTYSCPSNSCWALKASGHDIPSMTLCGDLMILKQTATVYRFLIQWLEAGCEADHWLWVVWQSRRRKISKKFCKLIQLKFYKPLVQEWVKFLIYGAVL